MSRLYDPLRVALRDLPLGVWAATVVFFGISLFGTFMVPLFSVPDERFHVDMIFAATNGDGYPRVGQRWLSPPVEAAGRLMLSDQRVEDPLPPRSILTSTENPCDPDIRPVPGCIAEPTFGELGLAYTYTGPSNRMATHPPLYYLVAGQTVATVTALTVTELPFDTHTWLYRVISVLLASTMPMLAGLGARQLQLGRPATVFAALSTSAVTGIVLRNAPIVNNDNLLMPLLAAGIVLLARLAHRGPTRRADAAIGVVLGLALLTKGFAMIFAVVLPVCLLLLATPKVSLTQHLREITRRTTRIAVIAFAAGGWWVLRNLLLYGTVSQPGFRVATPATPVETSFLAWAEPWLSGVFRQSFQATGDALLRHPIAALIVGTVVTVLLAVGTRHLGPRVAAALVLPLVGTLCVWGSRIFLDHLRHGEITAAQGRYFFPTMLGLVLVLAAGVDRIQRSSKHRLAAAVPALTALAIVGVTTGTEVRAELKGSWSPDGSVLAGVEQLIAWSPAPPLIMWLAVVTAILGGAGVLAATVPRARGAVSDR